MYYCPDCGYEFATPKKICERHSLDTPPYEEISVCPNCKNSDFYKKTSTHCRCCGAKLADNKNEYCSDICRDKGIKMWKRQLKKRQLRNQSPINAFVAELEYYNKQNKTLLSYGQYESIKYLKEQKSKCSAKRKNT